MENSEPLERFDLKKFFMEFQDYLAPKLDTYEQAIYLYIFRHSRLLGKEEITIGFKSARTRLAIGAGRDATPMSEGSVYRKLKSLVQKGCLDLKQTEHGGTRVRLKLPMEFLVVEEVPSANSKADIEEMDFFSTPELRELILQRESFRCF